MSRIIIIHLLCFLIGLKSYLHGQSVRMQQATTSAEIEKDYYYKLLKKKIKDKIIRSDAFLNNPEFEIILASIGVPQNAEFYVIQLVFFKDSLYLYEHVKDKRYNLEVPFRFNKVKSDSIVRLVANYFDQYQENHIQKYLSKQSAKRNYFENLRSIIIRKNGVENVVLFTVNGAEYSNENDNLPDLKLLEILELMYKNRIKYFNIPLD